MNFELITKTGTQWTISVISLITGSIPSISLSIKMNSILLFIAPDNIYSWITFILQSIAYTTTITFSICGTINLFKKWKENKKTKFKKTRS